MEGKTSKIHRNVKPSNKQDLKLMYDKNCSSKFSDASQENIREDTSNATFNNNGDSFFSMLQDYRPAVLGVIESDQRSPGPAEYLKGTLIRHADVDNANNNLESPKFKRKMSKFWTANKEIPAIDEQELENTINKSSICKSNSSNDFEERQRRRVFAHYDCQSLLVNLSYAAKLRDILLSQRKNVPTGASAASTEQSINSISSEICNNEMLSNCPYFINEIGGEIIREASLTKVYIPSINSVFGNNIHQPAMACNVSVLEMPSANNLWKNIVCPFQYDDLYLVEKPDEGAKYYRYYFYGHEHQNWFGIDEQLGPVAISIKREKVLFTDETSKDENKEITQKYRLIIRTSELLTLRGSLFENLLNTTKIGKSLSAKELIEYVAPEINPLCLKLGTESIECHQQLINLDEQCLNTKYKVGILYCKAQQSSEEDMYNNEDPSPAFIEFLETIGKQVRLKGFEFYKGGLDTKSDSTGLYSLYTKYEENEIMFHVSTMLPLMPNNRQQLLRKRHIGNDIVTVIFQEPGAKPFSPKNIRSQFQHVFIVVQVVDPCSEDTFYKVAISRSKDVPIFGPPIPTGGLFAKKGKFVDFLLAKIINAEKAVYRSDKFVTMAIRTRQEYLKDFALNYCTHTVMEHVSSKFSIFPKPKRDKATTKIFSKYSGSNIQRGAYCWQVILQDHTYGDCSLPLECFLGISSDIFVLIDECSKQIVFVCPTKLIIGWITGVNSMKIFHHQGECIIMSMRHEGGDRYEQFEIIERLKAVTQGSDALELTMKRNSFGQLGFHIQPNGLVTQVDSLGQAWCSGLRPGFRIIEICKIVVATLTHEQIVDILKTSQEVTLTVIDTRYTKDDVESTKNLICSFSNCKFNYYEFDNNEILKSNSQFPKKSTKKNVFTSQVKSSSIQRVNNRYARKNFSPPRSSNSSGYGTGSSSKSFGNTLDCTSSNKLENNLLELNSTDKVRIINGNFSRPTSLHDSTRSCHILTNSEFNSNLICFDKNISENNQNWIHCDIKSKSSSNLTQLKSNNRKGGQSTNVFESGKYSKIEPNTNFQEELLKLINIDDEANSDNLSTSFDKSAVIHTTAHPVSLIEDTLKITEPSMNHKDTNLNWSTLVNEATIAMMDIKDDRTYEDTNELSHLQSHLAMLETRIVKDSKRRKSLENTVRRLAEENRRLQNESHAAVQQLRTFTEWFFQTIDKQA